MPGTGPAMTNYASHLLQRAGEIVEQIVDVLEADREPHQPVADAELGALLRRQALVRRRRRMRDQALGIAEIVGDADERERVEEAERAGFAALDLEGDQGRAAGHLLGDDGGLRVVLAARIDEPRQPVVAGER